MGGTNSVSILSTVTNASGCSYSVTRTWRATDACGNQASCSQTVTVVDDRTPVLTCVPNKNVECGAAWTFDLPSVSQGTITNFTTLTNTGCGLTYAATRTWTAVDACGHVAQCSQTVNVLDTTVPAITCAANKSVEAGGAFAFDPPTLTEGCRTNSLVILSTVTNVSGCGYTVTCTWRATDACGNQASCSQMISVVDTTAPTITCSANKSVEAVLAYRGWASVQRNSVLFNSTYGLRTKCSTIKGDDP